MRIQLGTFLGFITMVDPSKGIGFSSKKFTMITKISSRKDTPRMRYQRMGKCRQDRSKISKIWRRISLR